MTKPGVACPRQLQKGNRWENACPPFAYFIGLILDLSSWLSACWEVSPEEKKDKFRKTDTQKAQSAKHKQKTTRSFPALPRKRKIELQPRPKAVPFLFALWGQTVCYLRWISRVCGIPGLQLLKRCLQPFPYLSKYFSFCLNSRLRSRCRRR